MSTSSNYTGAPRRSGFVKGTFNVRLGADPELRPINSERALVTFRGATNHVLTNENKEKVEQTTWFSFDLWCNVDEDGNPLGPAKVLLSRYKKGNWITVMGRLEISPWSRGDKEGVEYKVIVDSDIPYDNMPAPESDESEEEETVAPARGGRTNTARTPVASGGRRRGATSADSSEYGWQ